MISRRMVPPLTCAVSASTGAGDYEDDQPDVEDFDGQARPTQEDED